MDSNYITKDTDAADNDAINRLSTFYVIRWLYNNCRIKGKIKRKDKDVEKDEDVRKDEDVKREEDIKKLLGCNRSFLDDIFRCAALSSTRIDKLAKLADLVGIEQKYFTGREEKDRIKTPLFSIVELPSELSWEDYANIRISEKRNKRETLSEYNAEINKALAKYDRQSQESKSDSYTKYKMLKYYIVNGEKQPEEDTLVYIQKMENNLTIMDSSLGLYQGIDILRLKEYEQNLRNHLDHISALIKCFEWKRSQI